MSRETTDDGLRQWQRTLNLYVAAESRMYVSLADFHKWHQWGKHYRIGVIVLPHRLFMPGDCVVVEMGNGSNTRQKVWGVTGKGRRVAGYYMRYAAPYAFATYDAGPLRIPELPAGLVDQPLDHPEAWLFAKSLRADVAAWRLGTGMPPTNHDRRHS